MESKRAQLPRVALPLQAIWALMAFDSLQMFADDPCSMLALIFAGLPIALVTAVAGISNTAASESLRMEHASGISSRPMPVGRALSHHVRCQLPPARTPPQRLALAEAPPGARLRSPEDNAHESARLQR